MLNLRVTKTDPSNIKLQLSELPKRLNDARYLMGQNIAQTLQKEVKRYIPTGAGWLDIYRDSIKFAYDGKQWFVAGEKDVDIEDLDAEQILLKFGATDKQSQILSAYNPWPIDLVPGIDQPYKANVVVLSAGKSEIDARRQEIMPKLPVIRANLTKSGFVWNAYGLPTFNGRVTADLAFLGQRLELGLGPFKQTPHWKPAVDNLATTLRASLEMTKSQFEGILNGSIKQNAGKPSADVKTMFQNAVRTQVPKLP